MGGRWINGDWTPQRLQQLADMVAEGKSARAIGNVLGKTRNAIIGQCRRQGLQLTGTHPKAGTGVRPRNTREPRKPRVKLVAFKSRLSPSHPEVKPMPVEPLFVPTIALQEHHCRAVVSSDGEPFTFCGHQKRERSSYCPFHSSQFEYLAEPKKPTFFRDLRRRVA